MNKLTRFDWNSLTVYLLLSTIGLINIYSIGYDIDSNTMSYFNFNKQLFAFAIAILLITVIQFLDTKILERYASIFYLFGIFTLITVAVFGTEVSGSKSWFRLGSFNIQPSEFMKIFVTIAIAKILCDINTKIRRFKDLIFCFIILLTPVILIMFQPDAGSAIVFLFLIFVFHSEGMPFFVLLSIVISILIFLSIIIFGEIITVATIIFISIISIIIQQKKEVKNILNRLFLAIVSILYSLSVNFIFNKVFEQRHRDRFNILLGKEVDSQGLGYNINQSQIAIGSGRFSGKGFMQGTQTKGGFVPEQQTDYIFTTIGEEWGFIGSSFVLILFIFLIQRIIKTAYKQKNSFNRVFCLGFACILFAHIFINLGMVVGLVPTIGIPLPFISYGGSSLIAFSIFLGIFLRMEFERTN